MSGVFGLFVSNSQLDLKNQIQNMACRLKHFDWTICETQIVDDRIALGRAGINIFNKPAQPVCNSSAEIFLVMSGEIYNPEILPSELDETASLEKSLLWLYEKEGVEQLKKCKGDFIIAICDKRKRQIILINDHMGFYPTYISMQNGNFIFGPEIKVILSQNYFNKKLDLTAMAQYFRFQHLLGTRTFFEDIFLLPPATVLYFNYESGDHTMDTYWTFESIPFNENIKFGEAVDEASHLLKRAVRMYSEDEYRPGVYLSGGLDSRTILGFVNRRPVSTVSFGDKDCLDVIYAEKIANVAGSQHHWFDMREGKWVLDYVDRHLELTEGFHSWIHAHGISTLDEARNWMDVNLIGWCGGTVMGGRFNIEPQQIKAVDNLALLNRLFYLYTHKFTWPSLTESEETLLYTENVWKNVRGLAFDSFYEEFKPFENVRKDIRGESFFVRSHIRRLTQNMLSIYRGYIEVRIPFFDYDLMQFLYSIPAEVRGAKKLYWAMIQKELPNYAKIPNSNDGLLPLSTPILREMNELGVKLSKRVSKYSHNKLFSSHKTLYADYENYLRNDLRKWAEDILYDQQTIERGIFNPDFVRTMMNHHLSGNEEWTIGKIAPIITYEMMLRKYYDE